MRTSYCINELSDLVFPLNYLNFLSTCLNTVSILQVSDTRTRMCGSE